MRDCCTIHHDAAAAAFDISAVRSSTGTNPGADNMTYGQYIEIYESSIKKIESMLHKKLNSKSHAKKMRHTTTLLSWLLSQ